MTTPDWQDVERHIANATGAAAWIKGMEQADVLHIGDDRQFGIISQNALEFAYKAVIEAHGHEYPTSEPDGHDLTILTQLIRNHGIVCPSEDIPGENHRRLSAVGGEAVHADEHPPLDRRLIAEDIPDAIARLRDMVSGLQH